MAASTILAAAGKGIHLYLKGGNLAFKAPQGALDAELKQRIIEQKQEIIDLLKAEAEDKHKVDIKLATQPADGELPLSFAQQSLWLQNKISGGNASYNISIALRLKGKLSISALEHALTTIVERHQSLRTCFIEKSDGEPVQKIQDATEFSVTRYSLESLSPKEQEFKLAELAKSEASQFFDLGKDLMLKATLIELSQEEWVLLMTMHHIASDGWSMGVLVNEFKALYTAYVQGQSNPLPPLEIQYSDYAVWQRDWLQGDVLQEQLNYWLHKLEAIPAVHRLPLDFERPESQTANGNILVSNISQKHYQNLQQLCRQTDTTMFMALHAVFSVLLARYSGEKDIVVGTPIANREQAQVASLIGFFVNTLVLRSDLTNNPCFIDLLSQSRNTLLEAYEHQQVPFEQLVEHLQPQRNRSVSPLFQVLLVLQNNDSVELTIPDLDLSPLESDATFAKYDLTLKVTESEEGLNLGWEYNTDLFRADTIVGLAQHFESLLKALLAAPEDNVFQLNLLQGQEFERQFELLNCAESSAFPPVCLSELFEQQVAENGDQTAVVFGDTELSFKQLNNLANQRAHYLVAEQKLRPDSLVGIYLNRSIDTIVAILATLKAGGAYVPIDPQYPQERVAFILDDANVSVIFTHVDLAEQLPETDAHQILLDAPENQKHFDAFPQSDLPVSTLGLSPENLAYVIYTSGSTGRPKGVLIEQRSVVNLAHNLANIKLLEPGGTWGWLGTFAFDTSVKGLCQLFMGNTLHILEDECRKDPTLLCKYLPTIATLDCTPALVETWFDIGIEAQLPNLVIGGEKIGKQLWERLLNWQDRCQRKAFNLYGPTECTVNASYTQISETEPHIGRALNNTYFYIADEYGNLTPQGTKGELYISGSGLARGYLNSPELTADKFIPNPFYQDGQAESLRHCYRTGDLVCLNSLGLLEFVGRVDDQVKMNGYRIELGEIEAALVQDQEIDSAKVLVRNNNNGQKTLAAYVIEATTSTSEVLANALAKLKKRLPEYMVPTTIQGVEAWPLTVNGKLNKTALLALELPESFSEYVRPVEETEVALSQIWGKLLKLNHQDISSNASFFTLGGNSLMAIRMVAEIRTEFSFELTVKDVFENDSLAELAAIINKGYKQLSREEVKPVKRLSRAMRLSFAQQRLWLLDKINGGSSHYNIPLILRITGELNHDALVSAFTTIIERHQSLRAFFVEDMAGNAIQLVQEYFKFEVPIIDLSDVSPQLRKEKVAKMLVEEMATSFDLQRDLLLRARLLDLGESEYVLLASMHHIASDGWSNGILTKEFGLLYTANVENRQNPLAPLAVQYSDYADWQHDYLSAGILEQQFAYWMKQLADLPQVHSIPMDKPRPKKQTFNGANYAKQIDAALSQRFTQYCLSNKATVFMGIHALFSVLLSRYSQESDIVMGTPVANREQAEIAPLIGFFVNTVVLRSDLSMKPGFEGLLRQSKKMLLDAYANQQAPFEQLVERLQPERNQGYSPLFQVMLVLQNNEKSSLQLPDLSVSGVSEELTVVAKFDLTLTVSETPNGLRVGWCFNTDLFEQSTIARMADNFEQLLISVMDNPQENVFKLNMLNDNEHQWLMAESRNECRYATQLNCIHSTFEEQVKQNPHNVALIFGSEQVTYQQMNSKANQLARNLRDTYLRINEQEMPADTLVAIYLDRSVEMLVSILAVLKAGGAYVPVSLDYPRDRASFILDDTRAQLLICQHNLVTELDPILSELNHEVSLILADDSAEYKGHSDENLVLNYDVADLAYIIYTSGTTGQPKGVMQTHQNVSRLFSSTEDDFGFHNQDTWVLYHAFTFDFSVWEMWGALLYGGRLFVPSREDIRDFPSFCSHCSDKQVTVLNLTPSAFYAFSEFATQSDYDLSHLRYVIFGGDKLNISRLQNWWQRFGDQHPQLINMYGITETTVHVTYKVLNQEDDPTKSHIGRPLKDMQAYLLDEFLKPVAIGAPGELYIAGAGLARGYLNREDLTSSRFVHNPYTNAEDLAKGHKRLYKTGDTARRLPNGKLEYLGRNDTQVKIRGYRIELSDIENNLRALDEIKEVLVLPFDNDGSRCLVAYAVVSEGYTLESNDVRNKLRAKLPEYMLPAAFVAIDAIPLTINGKVNHAALPTPEFVDTQNYVAPVTELEHHLSEIWQEVLGGTTVGIQDNFFSVGGDSIRVVQLVKLANERGIIITSKDVFACQTIAALSEYLSSAPETTDSISKIPFYLIDQELKRKAVSVENLQGVSAAEVVDYYPVTSMQKIMLQGHALNKYAYHTQMVYELVGEEFDVCALEKAFNYVICKHPTLRTRFIELNDGQFTQFIIPHRSFKLQQSDWCAFDTERQQKELELLLKADLESPFRYGKEHDVLRLKLIKMSDSRHALFIAMHHAVEDGWGVIELMKELFNLYVSATERELDFDAIEVNNVFKEHVALELEAGLSESSKRDWSTLVANYQPMPKLTGADIQSEKQLRGSSAFEISAETATLVFDYAKRAETTAKTVLLMAYQYALARVYDTNNVTVDVVTSGRSSRLSEPFSALGLFWSLLPVNAVVSFDAKSDLPLLTEKVLQVDANANYPREQVLCSQGHAVVTDAAFNFVNFHNKDEKLTETSDVTVSLQHSYDNFHHPIKLFVSTDLQRHIGGKLEFDRHYLSDQHSEKLKEYFMESLNCIVSGSEQ